MSYYFNLSISKVTYKNSTIIELFLYNLAFFFSYILSFSTDSFSKFSVNFNYY